MYGEVQEGVAFIRCCFLRDEDANEFRARFAGIAKVINFPTTACG